MNGYVPEFLKDRFPVRPIGHLHVFLSDGAEDNIFPREIGRKNAAFLKKKEQK
ncbi:hypothetical protein [Oceanobacillus salinisoli]|uniref:hypothetical protein n=1 Tax=Oceanobacillus salinisoli TaxID=2678611 RepID=UPI0012E24AA1|nr:hypothetical protein [Oceanobacillus salinisoli]